MDQQLRGHRRWLVWTYRVIAAVVVLCIIVWFSRFAEHEEHTLEAWIGQLGWWAPVVFLALLIVSTAVGVPDTLFGVAAGALFGFWFGAFYFNLGVLLTAAITFAISRGLLRRRMERLLQKDARAAALERTLSEHGLKLLTLLRLTPISPVLTNYAAGVSQISVRDFCLGSLALIPGLTLEVYFGYVVAHVGSVASGGSQHPWTHTAAIIAGLLVCIVVLVYVAKLAKDAITTQQGQAI